MTTLNLTCSGSADHGAEQGGLNSVNSAASIRTNTEYSGHRFASATLASTDTINTAVPQIYDTYGTTLTFSMTVYCEAADNAAVYTTTAYSISSRAATTSPTAWTGTKPASPTYVTLPDITSHVTQVTGRGGWSSGNALNMIIRGNGGVRAVAPDGTAHPAKLDIDYTAGGGGATGTAAPSLPHLTASATGAMQPAGTAAATFPHLTASATGVMQPSGTATTTLPHLTASATGTSTAATPTGTIAAAFPHLTASATGTQTQSGTAAASLPHLTASATGGQSQTGTAAASLPHLTASASGAQSYIATGTASLPHLTASATGTQTITGTIAASFPHLTASGTDAEPTSNLIDVTGSYAPIVGILGSYTPTINATGSYAPTIDVTGRAS